MAGQGSTGESIDEMTRINARRSQIRSQNKINGKSTLVIPDTITDFPFFRPWKVHSKQQEFNAPESTRQAVR